MMQSPQQFYDDLAADYHLIFADWDESIARHGTALNRLIQAHTWDTPPTTLLDCSCGIGTQALGLAAHGYRIHATDVSPEAVARLVHEAAQRQLEITTGVADMRRLAEDVSGTYDVVLSCDNAVPHLLTDDDLLAAARGMYDRLRPGGLVLISIRDYDYYQEQQPRAMQPQVYDKSGERRIIFQVWDWADDTQTYQVTLFLVQGDGTNYRVKHFATTYRALLRGELTTILTTAGFEDIRWHMPQDTGYFQPVVTARTTAHRA